MRAYCCLCGKKVTIDPYSLVVLHWNHCGRCRSTYMKIRDSVLHHEGKTVFQSGKDTPKQEEP